MPGRGPKKSPCDYEGANRPGVSGPRRSEYRKKVKTPLEKFRGGGILRKRENQGKRF